MQDLLQANGLVLCRPRRNGIGYHLYVKAVVEQVASENWHTGPMKPAMQLHAGWGGVPGVPPFSQATIEQLAP